MLITKHEQCQTEADRVAIVNSRSSRLGGVSQKRGASGKRSQSRASSDGAGQRNRGDHDLPGVGTGAQGSGNREFIYLDFGCNRLLNNSLEWDQVLMSRDIAVSQRSSPAHPFDLQFRILRA